MEFNPILVVCLVLISGINFSQACGGYKLSNQKFENCGGPDQIMKVDENSTIELTSDCKVVLNGCVRTKAFKTAIMTFMVKKNGNKVFSGVSDICQDAEKPPEALKSVPGILQRYGFLEKCPVNTMDKCVLNQEIDISRMKGMIAIASGKLQTHLEVKHDTGISCMNSIAELRK